MLRVEGLTKYYGNFRAVENLTFQIAAGETVGLLGPNGAGKTTTLRLLTGFMPPTAGHVTVGDYDMMERGREAKRQIGYLPEHPPLYPDLTVTEYLQFVARLHRVPRPQIKSHIDDAIERTNLAEVSHRLVGNLSRGFQQRVGLAQVLVKKPPLLILDEPTVGLDPRQIIEIRELIKNLAGDYTIILSSHILQEVSATCDRVIIIHHGLLVAQDTQENLLLHRGAEERFRLRFKDVAVREARTALQQIDVVERVEEHRNGDFADLRVRVKGGGGFQEKLFDLLKQKDWVLYELSPERTSLEEVFLELTEEAES